MARPAALRPHLLALDMPLLRVNSPPKPLARLYEECLSTVETSSESSEAEGGCARTRCRHASAYSATAVPDYRCHDMADRLNMKRDINMKRDMQILSRIVTDEPVNFAPCR